MLNQSDVTNRTVQTRIDFHWRLELAAAGDLDEGGRKTFLAITKPSKLE